MDWKVGDFCKLSYKVAVNRGAHLMVFKIASIEPRNMSYMEQNAVLKRVSVNMRGDDIFEIPLDLFDLHGQMRCRFSYLVAVSPLELLAAQAE